MKTILSITTLSVVAGFALYACSAEPIQQDPGSASGTSGTPAGLGGTSQTAGQGGASAGSTGATVGGASGTNNQAGNGGAAEAGAAGSAGTNTNGGNGGGLGVECPKNGTTMVKLVAPDGTAYCMDKTEVSQAQYAQFLELKKGDMAGQDDFCAATNFTYEPRVQTSEDDPPGCVPSQWDPKGKSNYPVQCIDLCDARAYCVALGKRLCGKMGGGVQKFDPKDMNDPNKSQWYHACSQGGKNIYAYGNEISKEKCAENSPVDGNPDCHGSEPPFSEILNLTGNLAEFEDIDTSSPPISGSVITRAPKSGIEENSYRCDRFGSGSSGAGVTFRCCADL